MHIYISIGIELGKCFNIHLWAEVGLACIHVSGYLGVLNGACGRYVYLKCELGLDKGAGVQHRAVMLSAGKALAGVTHHNKIRQWVKPQRRVIIPVHGHRNWMYGHQMTLTDERACEVLLDVRCVWRKVQRIATEFGHKIQTTDDNLLSAILQAAGIRGQLGARPSLEQASGQTLGQRSAW